MKFYFVVMGGIILLGVDRHSARLVQPQEGPEGDTATVYLTAVASSSTMSAGKARRVTPSRVLA
jgi:hypothetical protein